MQIRTTKASSFMNNSKFGETMKNRTKAFESSSLRSAPLTADRLITEGTVGWATFGCGAGNFGVRGQAKRDPAFGSLGPEFRQSQSAVASTLCPQLYPKN